MNATLTMVAVCRCVPIYKDHDCVAADLGSFWLVMALPVQVSILIDDEMYAIALALFFTMPLLLAAQLTKSFILIWLLSFFCPAFVTSDAPDADSTCIDPGRTDPSPVRYTEDQRILFDTWNYERLLGPGGVLQTLNIDGEGSGVSSMF